MPSDDFDKLDQRIFKLESNSTSVTIDISKISHEIGVLSSNVDRLIKQNESLTTLVWSTTAATIFFVVTSALALLGLVYTARQDTTATMGAALSAIQTVISAKPSDAGPASPTVNNYYIGPNTKPAEAGSGTPAKPNLSPPISQLKNPPPLIGIFPQPNSPAVTVPLPPSSPSSR